MLSVSVVSDSLLRVVDGVVDGVPGKSEECWWLALLLLWLVGHPSRN